MSTQSGDKRANYLQAVIFSGSTREYADNGYDDRQA